MRFFTQVACFAVHHCNHSLLLATQMFGSKSLVVADILVASVTSRQPDMMWETVTTRFNDAMDTPTCIAMALPGIAESDYLRAFSEMVGHAKRLDVLLDTDDLLVRMARHGADACWVYATDELKFVPTPKAYDRLVDAAIAGGSKFILQQLSQAGYLPFEYRTRIHWKRELDAVVKGRNPNYIRQVLISANWLKAEDLMAVERFALRGRHEYLKKSVIDPVMDDAIGKWTAFLNAQVVAVGDNVVNLKQAA